MNYCCPYVLGPTISQDADLLEQTENPILGQLRKQREAARRTGSFKQRELDDLRDEIGAARRQLALLKKRR